MTNAMKYYEAHEGEYRKRLAAGQVAWDKGEYDDFPMLPLVELLLAESGISPPDAAALDLGCGTGALACLLASRGFAVTAIDVAHSAIAEAGKQADKRGLRIDFRVGDLCREELPRSAFDVVIDNHFLHCIVYAEERRFVLLGVRRALKPHGEFWLETMVGHADVVPSPDWNPDERGVTWHAIPPENAPEGCIERHGKTWIPIRRIQPRDEIVMAELREAGFEILWHETKPPSGEGEAADLRARCRAKVGTEAAPSTPVILPTYKLISNQ